MNQNSRKAGVITNYKGMPDWHDYQLPIKLTAATRTKTRTHIGRARYQAVVNATELRNQLEYRSSHTHRVTSLNGISRFRVPTGSLRFVFKVSTGFARTPCNEVANYIYIN